MVAAQKLRAARKTKTVPFGLLSNGSSGPWEVAIDEATVGAARWWMQVEGPAVSLYFEISTPKIVHAIIDLLDPNSRLAEIGANGSHRNTLKIGKDKKTPVSIINDDEYDDRTYVIIGPSDSPIVRVNLCGDEKKHFVEALRQAAEEIDVE